MNKKYAEKLSLIQSLIGVAKADGKRSELEMDFIKAVAEKMQVSVEDVDSLVKDNVEFTPPESEFERIYYFNAVLLVVAINKRQTAKEVQFCKDLGVKMGLNPTSVNTLIRKRKTYPNFAIPAKEIINIFKVNHN